jgi:nucleotide-binding universal stress UspA family protein
MYSKILVPLDGTSLAETAIGHAVELAHGTGAEIVLLNAAQDSLAAVPEARINASSLQVYGGAIRGMMYLQEVAGRIRNAVGTVRCDVLEGDPASAILSCAKQEHVDVIVMGTHRRTGLSRLIKGSVAGTVAAAANLPVILVKGEGRTWQEELAEAA